MPEISFKQKLHWDAQLLKVINSTSTKIRNKGKRKYQEVSDA